MTAVDSVIDENGRACLPGLHIVTDLTFLGTTEREHFAENPICTGEKVRITIRLTRCTDIFETQTFVDLDSFDIDLAQVRRDGKLKRSCWEFYCYTRLTNIPGKSVWIPCEEDGTPAYGAYALKVIISGESDDKDSTSVQGIASLKVCKPVESRIV